jgi:Site-specific recombinases, DNA invertase Pin homologs
MNLTQSDTKITALYERLSRDDEQQGDSNSIKHQKSMLEDYAAKNGFNNVVHFTDDGWSGTVWNRPGWQELIARVDTNEVSTIIIKDSSRMGRDYLRVGLYREMFREKNIRLISVNDGIDTAKGEDDFTPFREIMSEWYARDTSRKIKSVAKAKGNSGKRLTNAPIYGYRLDPNDKSIWIIDEEAAEIVRRIYRMTVEGSGPHMIAKALAADKIERSSYYMTTRGIVNYSRYITEENKYAWNTKTIVDMIAKPEYIGHTVNFRTSTESYKDKRRTKIEPADWKIFEHTHPAIIDEETWQLAQKCRETKRRQNRMGETNPLTGLLYCADCGAKMYNHREPKSDKMVYHKNIGKYYPRYGHDTYRCSNYFDLKPTKSFCTQHYIRTAAVRELLLDTIKNVSGYVRKNESEFMRQIHETSEIKQTATAKANRKQLAKNEKRIAELDGIISKLFEQNAIGVIPDKRFETLLVGYEHEQSELAAQNIELTEKLESFDNDSIRADKFIEIVKKYTDFTELTTPMIHEFVEKIVVHEGDKSSGERVQKVDIYLNFIGQFDAPIPEPTADEIAEMEKLKRRRQRKRESNHRHIEKRQREMAEAENNQIY